EKSSHADNKHRLYALLKALKRITGIEFPPYLELAFRKEPPRRSSTNDAVRTTGRHYGALRNLRKRSGTREGEARGPGWDGRYPPRNRLGCALLYRCCNFLDDAHGSTWLYSETVYLGSMRCESPSRVPFGRSSSSRSARPASQ